MITEEKLLAHPAADILPNMADDEFEKLKEDIAEHGLHHEIVRCDGQILDGRHRYRACLEIGLEPRFREYDGDDPVRYVMSANVHRRHLNTSQRAVVAAQLTSLRRGGDRSKAQICGLNHAQAAEQLNVSPRLVDKASALLNAANDGRVDPEVVEAVRDGNMRLEQASKEIPCVPKQQQKKHLSRKAARRPREQRMNHFEQFGLQVERLCSRMDGEVSHMRKAGQLTPERRKRLAGIWRGLAQRFTKVAENLEPTPQAGPDHLPLEEDVDLEGASFNSQALGGSRGVENGGDEENPNG